MVVIKGKNIFRKGGVPEDEQIVLDPYEAMVQQCPIWENENSADEDSADENSADEDSEDENSADEDWKYSEDEDSEDEDSEDEDSEDEDWKYSKDEHQSWCEYSDELIQQGVILDLLSDVEYTRLVTCLPVKKREPIYPPRPWSLVVKEGRVRNTCG